MPLDLLGRSAGAFLCDDYRGYDLLEKNGKRRRSGCLAHARRKYFDAGNVPEAIEALELISCMYQVEHEAERRDIVATAEHLALRREYTRPVFVARRASSTRA